VYASIGESAIRDLNRLLALADADKGLDSAITELASPRSPRGGGGTLSGSAAE
jgi:hypothetical protein